MFSSRTRSGRVGGSTTTNALVIRRASKKKKPAAFANDPVRAGRLPFSSDLAKPLPNHEHLQTGLIDFLLHNSFKGFVVPDELLLASSNSFEFFKLMTDAKKYPPQSPTLLEPIRIGYRSYASGPYRLLVVNCMGDIAHYNAMDIAFDINSDVVFHHVRVYDSLVRKTSNTIHKVTKSSAAGRYLCSLQQFLVRFCFFDKQETVQYKQLKTNPQFILNNATVEESPQQTNGWDCGLFAFGVVLHIATGIPVTRTLFTPENISQFREGLHDVLSIEGGGTRSRRRAVTLNPRWIYSFFPKLDALPSPVVFVTCRAGDRIDDEVLNVEKDNRTMIEEETKEEEDKAEEDEVEVDKDKADEVEVDKDKADEEADNKKDMEMEDEAKDDVDKAKTHLSPPK